MEVLLRPKMWEISLRGWLPLPEALALPEVLLLWVEVVQGWVNSQGGSFSCLVGVGWEDCLGGFGFGLGLGLGAMVVDAWGWEERAGDGIYYIGCWGGCLFHCASIVVKMSQLNKIKNC